MRSCLIDYPSLPPRDLLLRPLQELDLSLPGAPGRAELSKLKLRVVGTEKTSPHARAEWAEGFSTTAAAWALKPLRTDSVSRGLFISIFTRETIFLSISIRLSFFMKRPFLERRAVNERIESGADLPPGIPQIGSIGTCTCLFGSRVSAATANIPSPRLQAEKAPLEQSIRFPCCNLTLKTKQTRPWYDCPTSSLHMILRVAQTVV